MMAANTKRMVTLGARAVVLGKFHDVVLPCLTASQRAEIIPVFRQGIEDAMAMMDDLTLPAEFHSTLLALTNIVLAGLNRELP